MMSKDLVEVMVKIPKKLLEALDELAYFGWTQDKFFEHALRALISCHFSSFEFDFCHTLEEKYPSWIYTHDLGPVHSPEAMMKRLAKL